MKRKLKETFPKAVFGTFGTFALFFISVGVYTPFSENSYAYNVGYCIGSIIDYLEPLF